MEDPDHGTAHSNVDGELSYRAASRRWQDDLYPLDGAPPKVAREIDRRPPLSVRRAKNDAYCLNP